MFRYRFSRIKNPEEQNSQNQKSNNPPNNTGYRNYRNNRRSVNIEYSANFKNKNANPPEENPNSSEFVNKSKYRTTKTSQQPESEAAKIIREIKTNEESEQIPSSFKRRSYYLDKKYNNTNKDTKDNERKSSNEKIKEEKKNDNKNHQVHQENNNIRKKYARKFNRENDNNEKRNEENNEESYTSNSNINVSSKNVTGYPYTTGRLVNDSNDNLIKIDPGQKNEIKEKEKTENFPEIKSEENNSNINSVKSNEKTKKRYGKKNKTDDNIPQKDITSQKDEFKLEDTNHKAKRSSVPTSFGSRNNVKDLYNKQFSDIPEVSEYDSGVIDYKNNSNNDTRDNKLISSFNVNEKKIQEKDEIIKNEEDEPDINNNDQNLSKEKELNEEKNIDKDKEIDNENNKKDNNSEIKIEENNIDENDNNDYDNYNNNNNNKEEKNIVDKYDSNNQDNNIKGNNYKKSNIKNNEYVIMDNTFNEVEQFNAKTILKGELAEIYDELIKKNIGCIII